VREQFELAFGKMLNNTKDLVTICDQALKEVRDLSPTELLLDSTVIGSGIRRAVHHTSRVPDHIAMATLAGQLLWNSMSI